MTLKQDNEMTFKKRLDGGWLTCCNRVVSHCHLGPAREFSSELIATSLLHLWMGIGMGIGQGAASCPLRASGKALMFLKKKMVKL